MSDFVGLSKPWESAQSNSPLLPYKTAPWHHQHDATFRAYGLPAFALLFEVGTGKTKTAIDILRNKYHAMGGVKRTLILAPPIVLENWRREIKTHSNINSKEVLVLSGPGKKRVAALLAHAGGIVITNYEGLLMPELFAALVDWKPEILIADESHRLKNPASKRTKAVTRLAKGAKFRCIMTGTAITNTPMDLFSQWRILDGGETFGDNFYAFRNHYFWDRNAGMPKAKYFPSWVPKPGAFDEISGKLKKYSMRVKKAECLDLPPLVRKDVFVELSDEQARLYKEMKRDFISSLGDGTAAVAQLAITKALRLQQIVSGFVVTENLVDGSKGKAKLENPRRDALRDLLEGLVADHKVIVWAVFKENYAAIADVCNTLGAAYVEVHGEIPAKAKTEAVDRFNTEPGVRVLICHPRSGGIGINLVAASYAVFYSRSFSLEDDIQAEARNYRGGSEIHAKVTRIDLIARGTIDEEIAAALARKQAVSESVLREIARKL